MQPKISSFFKLSPTSPSPKWVPPPVLRGGAVPDDGLDLWLSTRNSFQCTYKRIYPTRRSDSPVRSKFGSGRGPGAGNVLNKKRRYPQMFLELGQSDFNLRTCSTCGIKYSPDDDLDEKHHTTFHKNYTKGIPFKMQEVIRMMEIELGDGWILRNSCKVYMFISFKRVAGCLVAEPIKEAFEVISSQRRG